LRRNPRRNSHGRRHDPPEELAWLASQARPTARLRGRSSTSQARPAARPHGPGWRARLHGRSSTSRARRRRNPMGGPRPCGFGRRRNRREELDLEGPTNDETRGGARARTAACVECGPLSRLASVATSTSGSTPIASVPPASSMCAPAGAGAAGSGGPSLSARERDRFGAEGPICTGSERLRGGWPR
jgi:hypothetical protein